MLLCQLGARLTISISSPIIFKTKKHEQIILETYKKTRILWLSVLALTYLALFTIHSLTVRRFWKFLRITLRRTQK